MLRGDDFNGLEKPPGMGAIKKRQLDPILLSMMPEHAMKKEDEEGEDANNAHRMDENVQRLKKVKKIIQKQRWMKMKNSNFTNPIDNMERIMKQTQGPKIMTQAQLMRSYVSKM